MASSQAEKAAKIDALMEQASRALVERDYFECERLAASALRRAHHESDYDRMARILLPLQEARRQKREMALDTGRVTIVQGELPQGRALLTGCYLVVPPRVGVDGRLIRDMADERRIPVAVLVREPTSRDGLWPIVAVGPVTVRTKVAPPPPLAPKKTRKPAKPKADAAPHPPQLPQPEPPPLPTIEWFVHVCEQLGDEAINQVPATLPAANRVDALLERLEAHPNHEKLHQRLADACREAMLEPPRKKRPAFEMDFEDEDELNGRAGDE